MKTLSLKLNESVFEETEGILKEKVISRNRYINEALEFYNRCHKRKKLAKALAKALAYVFIDTGAMYRAVALYFLRNNIEWYSVH